MSEEIIKAAARIFFKQQIEQAQKEAIEKFTEQMQDKTEKAIEDFARGVLQAMKAEGEE